MFTADLSLRNHKRGSSCRLQTRHRNYRSWVGSGFDPRRFRIFPNNSPHWGVISLFRVRPEWLPASCLQPSALPLRPGGVSAGKQVVLPTI